MSSKTPPLRYHAAIFNSLKTIQVVGGGEELITKIKANYSGTVYSRPVPHKSRFIKQVINRMGEEVIIDWKGTAVTINEIIDSISDDGIPDVAIQEIDFAIPWTEYDEIRSETKQTYLGWSFKPQTFRPTVWERLKAEQFPAQKLYNTFKEVRRQISKDLDPHIKKRWRDVILMNLPKQNLTNEEIRVCWQNKRYALLLKESKGDFELMDLGEWKV